MGSQTLKVRLPDGNTIEIDEGGSTADVASAIGPGLARAAIAGVVTLNGDARVVDLSQPLPGDCDLTILTTSDDKPESLLVLRHSAAHVMAEAVCKLFPTTRLVYGPPLEDGFYYDIDLDHSITPDDFAAIEAEMKRIVKEKRPFTRVEMSRSDAMAKLRKEESRYKIDNAERAEGDTLSFYVTGDCPGEHFEDLCRGPHVPTTGVIKSFKIQQVSRSHYRGDVNDQPLQRLYGTAFFKKASLTEHLTRLEEAKRRDHRVIGKALNLFTISEKVGSGLILWLPKGATIRTQLQNYLTEEMEKLGYDLVYTPQIGQLGLYRTSGHFPYYEESIFPAMFESDRGKAVQSALQLAQRVAKMTGDAQTTGLASVRAMLGAIAQSFGPLAGAGEADGIETTIEVLNAALVEEPGFLVRPMNCPHHIQIYASAMRSYRDLPLRIAEYGTVYRFEQSGEISGLTRVRGFTVDDAHLFCTPDQLAVEVSATVDLTRRVLKVLGLTDYRVRIGLRDDAGDKWVGSRENWDKAQEAVQRAVTDSGIPFTIEEGEAAFYGPKIDFVVKDCIGRSWQLGTVQVDYNLPERFDLTYVGPDNAPHRPIMIHRAPFGSMERFVGILIEHFEGAFPLWLSPVQVAVTSVSEKSAAYARIVYDTLKAAGLRSELDVGDEKIGPKKHRFRAAKVNYIVVVGEQEAADETVNVNDRDGTTVGTMQVHQLIAACMKEIDTKGSSTVELP